MLVGNAIFKLKLFELFISSKRGFIALYPPIFPARNKTFSCQIDKKLDNKSKPELPLFSGEIVFQHILYFTTSKFKISHFNIQSQNYHRLTIIRMYKIEHIIMIMMFKQFFIFYNLYIFPGGV